MIKKKDKSHTIHTKKTYEMLPELKISPPPFLTPIRQKEPDHMITETLIAKNNKMNILISAVLQTGYSNNIRQGFRPTKSKTDKTVEQRPTAKAYLLYVK